MAIADEKFKLDVTGTIKELQEIENRSNLMEVIVTDTLKGRDVKTNQVVCDGRLKASIVVDDKWVIEIHENSLCNYQKSSSLL